MQLETHEIERFYNIWSFLLYYVNQQKQIIPPFPGAWGDSNMDENNLALLRDALWADDSLRENFIKENPANLSPQDLALVDSWQYRIAGDFFIFRYLKKHAVFLSSNSPTKAYGVLELMTPFEYMFNVSPPIYVKAVLIPFEGRIIYDGQMASYSISFGGGYRRSLTDAYRNAQEREGVITTLAPDPEANRPENIKKAIRQRNKKLLRVFQKELGQSGLSPKKMEEHTGSIADFGEEFLLTQDSPHGLIETTLEDVQTYLETAIKKVNLVSFKRFARFLRDTERMDYYDAEHLLDFLKLRK